MKVLLSYVDRATCVRTYQVIYIIFSQKINSHFKFMPLPFFPSFYAAAAASSMAYIHSKLSLLSCLKME
jgi:hypothetical protein